jgi:hypothetical protein
MDLYVQGVGVLGPGLEGWPSTRSILRGEEPHRIQPTSKPVPGILPATERRRSSEAARLTIAVAQEALRDRDVPLDGVPTVFVSSDGDGEITHRICESLAGPTRDVSPTSFHNSVHNAPAGYWSIATGARSGSTSLCAYDVSFAGGLVEAAVQATVERQPVMLIASDLPFPTPLYAVRPVDHSFAVALLLTQDAMGEPLTRWRLSLEPHRVPTAQPGAIDASVLNNPAARCLPLLEVLACGRPRTVSLDYLDPMSLIVSCEA